MELIFYISSDIWWYLFLFFSRPHWTDFCFSFSSKLLVQQLQAMMVWWIFDKMETSTVALTTYSTATVRTKSPRCRYHLQSIYLYFHLGFFLYFIYLMISFFIFSRLHWTQPKKVGPGHVYQMKVMTEDANNNNSYFCIFIEKKFISTFVVEKNVVPQSATVCGTVQICVKVCQIDSIKWWLAKLPWLLTILLLLLQASHAVAITSNEAAEDASAELPVRNSSFKNSVGVVSYYYILISTLELYGSFSISVDALSVLTKTVSYIS